MMNNDRFHDLVSKLYASLLDQDGFQLFIASLVEVCRLRSATILLLNQSTGQIRVLGAQGFDIKWKHVYEEKFIGQDPLMDMIHAAPIGQFVYISEEFAKQETVINSDFNQQWLKPQNIAYAGGAILSQRGDWLTQIFVQRTTSDGPFSEKDVAFIELLFPHLARVMEIFQRSHEPDQKYKLADNFFNQVQIPAVFLDIYGKVCHQNQKAHHFFARQQQLQIINHRLVCTDSQHTSRLESAIHNSFADKKHAQQSVETFRLTDGTKETLSLMIMPLHDQQSDWATGAVAFLFDTQERLTVSGGALQSLFRLTEGESRVCQELVAGKSPAEIAQSLHYSLETVRSYIKRIMKKTGTSRQNDLVALILASPALFHQEKEAL